MIHYPTINNLELYRSYEALSQSFLKSVLANNTKRIKETIPMIVGSYLDALLTCPNLVDSLFHIGLSKRPSDVIKSFIDELWEQVEQTVLNDLSDFNLQINKDLEVWKELLILKIRKANYQPNWGDDAVWKSIIKDGQSYWEELISSFGKKIITVEEDRVCKNIAALTLSSPITGKYFLYQKNVDTFFQKEVYWNFENEPCKGLIDLLIIDHPTKKIHIIDIKTTGVSSVEEWFTICKNKRYEFQLSFYKKGIEQEYHNLITNEKYTIHCKWMVIPTNFVQFKPWIIPCTDEMLFCGKYGFIKISQKYLNPISNKEMIETRRHYKGWIDAIVLYKKCKEEELLDYDLNWYNNQGKLPIENANELFFN